MWYIGYSGAVRQVGHATSSDGASWTKDADPVLSPGGAGAWDNSAIHSLDVIANGSSYEMWYAATSDFDFSAKIGYASSDDGVAWQKLEANPQNLTNNAAAQETSPSWSPDGTQIAYERGGDIWTMNADGSSPALFIDNGGTEQDPAWSPDGATIAFASDVTGNFEIWKADVATATPTQVTFRADNGEGVLIQDVEPTWSPDSAKIAYASSDPWSMPGDYDLFVINADGSNDLWLDNTPGSCRQPAWSPNGNWIAYNEDGNIKVFQPQPGGGAMNHNNLTSDFMATDIDPTWSPDSNRVLFSRDGNLWVLNFNNSEPWNSGPASQFSNASGSQHTEPAWAPDAPQIAFASDETGDSDVWVMGSMANPIITPNEWSWEENGVFSPSVLKDGSTYHMWYAGTNNSDDTRIGHATSTDGKGWNKDGANPVLNTVWHDFNWEDGDVTAPDVLKTTSYQMWYEGCNWDGNVVAIGKASSFNGSTWSRNPDNPVLQEGLQGAIVLASYSYAEGMPERSIVKVNAADGSYVDHFQAPNWEQVGGLATDGVELYGCRVQWGNEIWQINPDDGSWSSIWPGSDKGYWIDGGDALAYKDGDLYYGKSGSIYVINWDSSNIYERYDTGLTGINGLSFVGDVLYMGASVSPGKIYKSALPGTIEKSTIGDYEASIEVVSSSTATSDPVAFSLEKLDEAVDLVVTSPEDGTASDTPEIDITGTVNDPSIDSVQVGIQLPSTMLLDDGMEDGDSVTGDGAFQKQDVPGEGWMPYSDKNLWHLSKQHSFSGEYAWAYNNADGWGFNTPGFANAGAIVSEPFNIGEDCQLNFWTSWDTDSWVDVDQKLIDINIDGQWQPLAYIVDGDWYPDPFGGSRQRIIVPMAWMWKDPWAGTYSGDDPNWNWYEVSIDLGMYAGANDAQVRFRLDTMDDWMNDFEGWYMDDVTVEGAGFKGITAEVIDLAFSASYNLAEGYNEITVSAQSGYIVGPEGRDTETLTVSLDTTGPIITLSNLPESTNHGTVEVSGTVFDLNFDNLVVTINDKPFYTLTEIPDGQEAPEWDFSTQVPLFEGENVIVATGTDAAGLTGSDTISIIRDSTPPTIEELPTVYYLGENTARTGDLLIFQVNAVDLAPEGTDYEPAGVAGVFLGLPGEGDEERFITTDEMPEAITDCWGTTGTYLFPIELPDDAPPGTYSLPIIAVDEAGNEAIGTVTAEIVSSLSAYNIYLMPGWNLISLPLIPDDSDIGNLLGSVRGVESVWYFNATSQSWEVYTPGDAPDSLTTMETGRGYWVFMDENDFEYSAPLAPGLPETPAPIKFSYTGEVLEPAAVPPTYSLEAGWNLIGLHSERVNDVSLYLRPVTVPQQVWASLLQYDNYIKFEMGSGPGPGEEEEEYENKGGEDEGGVEVYLGCFRTLLETDQMEPGKGYWLYLVEPGEVVAQP
jgi:Tol biopolymer transport system component